MILVAIDYLPTYAQNQKTKITITKETYDENGNKTVQTIVKEGAEADAIDLDQLLEGSDQPSIRWKQFDLDSMPTDDQFFNYSFKNPQSLRSLFDSLGLGNFDFFGQNDFQLFGGPGMELNPDMNKPKLGVRISDIESQSGVLVNEVVSGSPADKAGMKEGDIIVSLDDQKIESPEDVVNYIQSRNIEDQVILDILRDGEYMQITVELSTLKPKKEMDVRKL